MKYESLFHRLCAHVEIEEYHPFCWTWVGPTRRHAGGHRPAVGMRVPGQWQLVRQRNACRVMCEIIHGPCPEGHECSHLCDENWLCVNPDHLLWETPKQNIARRDARLRDERAMDHTIPMPKVYSIEAPF